MDVCLEILNEQIKNFKESYIGLVGAYQGVLEFSNYSIDSRYSNRVQMYQKQLQSINDKLKGLYEHLLDLKNEVSKL